MPPEPKKFLWSAAVSPEMPLGESSSGTGFQVVLEGVRLCIVLETDDDDGRPGLMLSRVRRTARVVLGEAFAIVGRTADVALGRIGETLEKIHVFHREAPDIGGRSYFAPSELRRTNRPSSFARPCAHGSLVTA